MTSRFKSECDEAQSVWTGTTGSTKLTLSCFGDALSDPPLIWRSSSKYGVRVPGAGPHHTNTSSGPATRLCLTSLSAGGCSTGPFLEKKAGRSFLSSLGPIRDMIG